MAWQIKVLFLSSTDVRSHFQLLESRWQRALPATAIQKHHIFKCAGNAELYISHYSSEHPLQKYQVLSHETADTNEDASDDINAAEPTTEIPRLSGEVGDWVLVRYDQSVFPGEVKEIEHDEVKVSVMVPSASGFKWPDKEDAIFYRMVNVIQKLKPPSAKSARGAFQFSEEW